MTRHLISTSADVVVCRLCGACVISAYVDGWPVRCDPMPLDILSEAIAIIGRRNCYLLTRTHDLIDRRDGAGMPGHVLTTHVCGQPLSIPALREPKTVSDECPY